MAAAAMIALTAAGTASQFLGQRNAASSARAEGNFQQGIATANADIANLRTTDAIARGEEAASQVRGQTTQLVGSQRASLASQGIDVNSGSAAETQNDARFYGALDELTLRNNAKREAWGYQVDALNATTQGRLAQLAAKNTASAYNTASLGTLLTGASQIGSIYQNRPQKATKAGS